MTQPVAGTPSRMRNFAPDILGGKDDGGDGVAYLSYSWGGTGNVLGVLRANMTFCPLTPTFGADEIGILINPNAPGGTHNFAMNVRWSDSNQRIVNAQECYTQSGAAGADGTARLTLNIYDFGPIPFDGLQRVVWLPCCAHFFKIGIYCDEALSVEVPQTVQLSILRRNGGAAPQATV